MHNARPTRYWFPAAAVALVLLAGAAAAAPADRFRLEVYGGVSLLNPRDLNLLSRAEEQVNQLLYIENHLGWEGYFINDFPEVSSVLPAGVRIRYRLSRRLSVSLEAEAFRRTREASISGAFTYAPSWSLTEAKDYAPFRLSLRGLSVLGGLHYGFGAGRFTEIEVGAAAGWTRAEFAFRSTWTYTISLVDPGFTHFSQDGGTLEEDGRGGGFAARAGVRLNRALGRRFGVFAETSATYCRLRALRGGGRETRLGIPGETVWQDSWGLKRENIEVAWGSVSVLVPTNYWEGWVAGQRERDFVLDLSGARLSLGIYVTF